MSLWAAVENGFQKTGHFIEDIVTIDVVTLTGDIGITQNEQGDPPPGGATAKELSLGKLYKRLSTQALGANLQVVAFTHIEVDADSVNFVNAGLAGDNSFLLEAHNEAVKAAEETREGIVRTVKSFFPV